MRNVIKYRRYITNIYRSLPSNQSPGTLAGAARAVAEAADRWKREWELVTGEIVDDNNCDEGDGDYNCDDGDDDYDWDEDDGD